MLNIGDFSPPLEVQVSRLILEIILSAFILHSQLPSPILFLFLSFSFLFLSYCINNESHYCSSLVGIKDFQITPKGTYSCSLLRVKRIPLLFFLIDLGPYTTTSLMCRNDPLI